MSVDAGSISGWVVTTIVTLSVGCISSNHDEVSSASTGSNDRKLTASRVA
jgi:hypothetical protein